MIHYNTPPHTNGRPREKAHLRELVHFVQRNRLLVLGMPALVVAAALLFLLWVNPIWEAAASIRIDENQSNVAVLDALRSISSGSEIDTEMEELRSRSLAEEVVDELDLHVALASPRRVSRDPLFQSLSATPDALPALYTFEREDAGWRVRWKVDEDAAEDDTRLIPRGRAPRLYATGEPIPLPGLRVVLADSAESYDKVELEVTIFPEAVRAYARRLAVHRPNRDANFVVVRYTGPDRLLVGRVPNVVAAHFVERRNEVMSLEARSTVAFLGEQLDTLSLQLVTAEESLRDLREGERIVAPEAEAEAQIRRLADMQAEREMVVAERDALQALLQDVSSDATSEDGVSPFRRLIAFPTIFSSPATGDLLASLAAVETQRAVLLDRRTPADPEVQVLTQRIRGLEEQLAAISRTYLQGLQNQATALDRQLERFGDMLATIPAREIRFARLERQAEMLEEIYLLLSTRQKEAQIQAAVEDPSVRIVDVAIPPREPVQPKPVLTLILATLVGLTLGAGSAFAREHLDNRVRTREDVIELTGGVPILGTIPRIPEAVQAGGISPVRHGRGRAAGFENRLVAGRDPHNPATEAYRSLRTNITFSRPERAPRTLVFTSPTPGDGKSTSAANLAITLAQQELRVLLVDADMRRGVMHEVFGQPREPGLSNVLLGQTKAADAIHTVQAGEVTLDFLAMGTAPPNPAELVGAKRMRALLTELEADYDAIILDAPPLAVVTDAALLGKNADGMIVVARSGVTEKAALGYAVEQIHAVRAPLLGAVLNDVDVKKDRYYGGYSAAAYYYAAEENGR